MFVAIIQARQSSSRLPNKVLKNICNKPMIVHLLERVRESKNIDKIVLATSVENSDDLLAKVCLDHGFDVYRGSLDDVLERYYNAAQLYRASDIIRITGDCPLVCPKLIDEMITFYSSKNIDYLGNSIDATYPDGLDVEIFSYESLKTMRIEATRKSEREHVTSYIHNNPSMFNTCEYKGEIDLSHMRWTVDEQEDFDFVNKIYSNLYPIKKNFSTEDVLRYIKDNPNISDINGHLNRNESYINQISKELEE